MTLRNKITEKYWRERCLSSICYPGFYFFLTKFGPKLSKIWIFERNLNSDQNFNSCPKFQLLTKISIIDQNFNYWPKFQFLTKISVLDQNFNVWPEFEFLTEIWIFDQNFNFWLKLSYLTKIKIYLNRFYIYAVHGVLVEVCFTSIYDMIEKYLKTSEVDFRFIGYSHIWALFIYGMAMIMIMVRKFFVKFYFLGFFILFLLFSLFIVFCCIIFSSFSFSHIYFWLFSSSTFSFFLLLRFHFSNFPFIFRL